MSIFPENIVCHECQNFFVISIIKNHIGCFEKIVLCLSPKEQKEAILYTIKSGQLQFINPVSQKINILDLFPSEDDKIEILRASIENYSPDLFSLLLYTGFGNVVKNMTEKYPESVFDTMRNYALEYRYKNFLEVYRNYEEDVLYAIKEPCEY